MSIQTHEALEALLEATAQQGYAEEIARLRAFLRLADSLFLPEQRSAFLTDDETMATLEGALAEDDVPPANDVEALIDAARTHGEDSEPDMEPGDLQVYLRTAYGMLDPGRQARFWEDVPHLGFDAAASRAP